jgi:hypothetical protein
VSYHASLVLFAALCASVSVLTWAWFGPFAQMLWSIASLFIGAMIDLAWQQVKR